VSTIDAPTTATTLAERKRLEAERRIAAADRVATELGAYARDRGGRYVAFGSYVEHMMRFDSDLDLLVDFPPDRTAEAWGFAEDAAVRHRIPLDLHDARTTKPVFLERVLRRGRVLP
jgi:predicted nucleotidyltransferase